MVIDLVEGLILMDFKKVICVFICFKWFEIYIYVFMLLILFDIYVFFNKLYKKCFVYLFIFFFWVKGKMILLDLFIEIKIFNDNFEWLELVYIFLL